MNTVVRLRSLLNLNSAIAVGLLLIAVIALRCGLTHYHTIGLRRACLWIGAGAILAGTGLLVVRLRVKPRSYLLPAMLTVLLLTAILEGYARWSKTEDILAPSERILYLEGLPEADQLRKDRTSLRLSYYDYHLYAFAPQALSTINFTTYFSARNTPASVSIDQANFIVWMFGGSTLQNTETIDELTIANQVASSLNDRGRRSAVVNFGVGGFHSTLEVVKFEDILRRVPPAQRPNVVVFYDGFNDAVTPFWSTAINIPYNLTCKIDALVTGDIDMLCLYVFSKKSRSVVGFLAPQHRASNRSGLIC